MGASLCCRTPLPILLVSGTKVSFLQKEQVEFRAVPKRASRLIRGGDPPLQEGNKAHMMQKHKPPPEMSVAKRKIYIPMSVWTEALAGHCNHGGSHLQKGCEQKRLRWQCSPCSPFDLTLASCRAI